MERGRVLVKCWRDSARRWLRWRRSRKAICSSSADSHRGGENNLYNLTATLINPGCIFPRENCKVSAHD